MKQLHILLGFLLSFVSFTGHSTLIFSTDLSTFEQNYGTQLVEDFESVSTKDKSLQSLNANGITYTGNTNVFVASPGYVNFGVPSSTSSSVLTANGFEDFTLTFSMDVNSIGFDTYLTSYGPAEISIFGEDGLLGHYTLEHDPQIVGFFGVSSALNITSIRWDTSAGRPQLNTGIDNIRINANFAVPEPSTLWMFFIAFLLFFGRKTILRVLKAH